MNVFSPKFEYDEMRFINDIQEGKVIQYNKELNAVIDKLPIADADRDALQDAIYKVVDINRREAFRQGMQQVADFVFTAEDKPSSEYKA